jgi:uncharacterized protein (DUF1499 family)
MKKLALGLVIVTLLTFMSLGFRAPRPANLGAPGGRLAPCPASPNCVSSQAEDAGHQIAPFSYLKSLAESRAALKQAIAGMSRARVITDQDHYLHAEYTSLICRFVDDVEFAFDDTNRVIQVRSASRVGYSDLGVNRKRVETLRSLLPEEMRGKK